MGHALTVDVSDVVYEKLHVIGAQSGRTPEQLAEEWLENAARAQEEDPLLRLSGIIETDIPDVSDRHDEYLGLALAGEARGGNGA